MKKYQIREIILWMVRNKARCMTLHVDAFKELLDTLGFAKASFSDALRKELKVKTYEKITRTGLLMRKAEVITGADYNLPTEASTFAAWSEAWLDPTFDGPIEKPSDWKAPRGWKAPIARKAPMGRKAPVGESEAAAREAQQSFGCYTPASTEERFEVEETQVTFFIATADTSKSIGGDHRRRDQNKGYGTIGMKAMSNGSFGDDENDDEYDGNRVYYGRAVLL